VLLFEHLSAWWISQHQAAFSEALNLFLEPDMPSFGEWDRMTHPSNTHYFGSEEWIVGGILGNP
jgi:hypothetical protein